MTTELIDWTTVPRLTQTNEGEFLMAHEGGYAQVLHTWKAHGGGCCIKDVPLANLRLAPADQQPWLVYEEGVTVIPAWAEVTYLVAKKTYYDDVELFKEDEYLRLVNNPIVQYKLGDTEGKLFKDGWTDNPNEVTE